LACAQTYTRLTKRASQYQFLIELIDLMLDRHVCVFTIAHRNINHEVNVTMLTFGWLTNSMQNEWNVLGQLMSPLYSNPDGKEPLKLFIYPHLSNTYHLGFYRPEEDNLYLGFEDAPPRPDDYEAFGMFIVERKPNSALITIVLPLIFMSWFGVFGTLIPKESGEKLRFI